MLGVELTHAGTQFESTPTRSGSDDTLLANDQAESTPVRRGSAEWPTTKPRLESHSSSYVVPSRRSNKPILKKRSNSEMMLARHNIDKSQYTPSADTADEGTPEGNFTASRAVRPVVVRTHSANSALRSARKQHFRKETGGQVPKRRIHFNESVEQCISIIKPEPDDGYDSSSSEDAPTMRISTPKPPINIAKLPSTTLKLPSPATQNGSHTHDITTGYLGLDEETSEPMLSLPTSGSDMPYLSRTNRPPLPEASMLPNYDGIQDDSPPPGIFGRAAEVVSSARDLVSVIWSASGWRRPDNGL